MSKKAKIILVCNIFLAVILTSFIIFTKKLQSEIEIFSVASEFKGNIHAYIHQEESKNGYYFLIDLERGRMRLKQELRSEFHQEEAIASYQDLIAKLENAINEDNIFEIQRICDEDYESEGYRPPEYINIISKVDGAVLKYFIPQYFISNEQLTYFVHKGIIPEVGNYIIDVNTMKIINIKDMLHGKYSRFKNYTFSPDGKILAFSASPSRINSDTLIVMDLRNKRVILKKELFKNIESIAWSPDSKSIACLARYVELGFGPIDFLVSGGHGVPYSAFYLLLINVQKDEWLETTLKKEVRYGTGKILWIK